MEIVHDMKPIEEVVFNSYESPLKALRRTQLWRLADIHGIEYPDQAPSKIMLRLLENAEAAGTEILTPPKGMTQEQFWKIINGVQRLPEEQNKRRMTGQTNVDRLLDVLSRMEAPKEDEVEIPEEAVEAVEKMPLWKLRKLAKEMGISQKNTDTTEILRDKILGQDTA